MHHKQKGSDLLGLIAGPERGFAPDVPRTPVPQPREIEERKPS